LFNSSWLFYIFPAKKQRNVLAYFFEFFSTDAQYDAVATKMNATNLALVLSPNFFHSDKPVQPGSQEQMQQYKEQVCD
jgi:hypothetical protein